MAMSDSNRQFIDSLIDYYISEAGSYRQIAEQYVPEIESVPDAAFGIIAGCVYSSFLEMCRNQDIQPGLEEMTEFNRVLKERAAVVKKAIIDPSSIATEGHVKDPNDRHGEIGAVAAVVVEEEEEEKDKPTVQHAKTCATDTAGDKNPEQSDGLPPSQATV